MTTDEQYNLPGLYFRFKVPGDERDLGLYTLLTEYINDELSNLFFDKINNMSALVYSKVISHNNELFILFFIYKFSELSTKSQRKKEKVDIILKNFLREIEVGEHLVNYSS